MTKLLLLCSLPPAPAKLLLTHLVPVRRNHFQAWLSPAPVTTEMLSPDPSAQSHQSGGQGWTPVPWPRDGAGWSHADSTVSRIQDFCPEHFPTEGQVFLCFNGTIFSIWPQHPSPPSHPSPPLGKLLQPPSPQLHPAVEIDALQLSTANTPPRLELRVFPSLLADLFPLTLRLWQASPQVLAAGGAAGSGTCCPQTTPRQGTEAASW